MVLKRNRVWVLVNLAQDKDKWGISCREHSSEPLGSIKAGNFALVERLADFNFAELTLAGIRQPVAFCGPTVEKHNVFRPLACVVPLRVCLGLMACNGATFITLLPATCHSICAASEGRRLLGCQRINVLPSQQVSIAVALVKLQPTFGPINVNRKLG